MKKNTLTSTQISLLSIFLVTLILLSFANNDSRIYLMVVSISSGILWVINILTIAFQDQEDDFNERVKLQDEIKMLKKECNKNDKIVNNDGA